ASEGRTKWLAHLYSLWEGHEEQAFQQLDSLTKNCSEDDRCYIMTDLPAVAFKAGHIERAQEAAEELITLASSERGDWNYGNAINAAHTTLGRIALSKGDVAIANHHLALSIIDIASPQTTSFGPALELAQELADAGQREVVLSYLDAYELLCGLGHKRAFAI